MSALVNGPRNYFTGWSWHRCDSSHVKITIDDQSYIFNAPQLRRFCSELLDDIESTPGTGRWSMDETSDAIEQARRVRAELLALSDLEPEPLAKIIPFPVVHRMARAEARLEALPELRPNTSANEALHTLDLELEALSAVLDSLQEPTVTSQQCFTAAEHVARAALAIAKIGAVLRAVES